MLQRFKKWYQTKTKKTTDKVDTSIKFDPLYYQNKLDELTAIFNTILGYLDELKAIPWVENTKDSQIPLLIQYHSQAHQFSYLAYKDFYYLERELNTEENDILKLVHDLGVLELSYNIKNGLPFNNEVILRGDKVILRDFLKRVISLREQLPELFKDIRSYTHLAEVIDILYHISDKDLFRTPIINYSTTKPEVKKYETDFQGHLAPSIKAIYLYLDLVKDLEDYPIETFSEDTTFKLDVIRNRDNALRLTIRKRGNDYA